MLFISPDISEIFLHIVQNFNPIQDGGGAGSKKAPLPVFLL